MEQSRLDEIRRAEKESHLQAYSENALYQSGSWLAKPVKTVLELLPLFKDYDEFCALDLGCGVGRNSIALARAFSDIPCRVDCVDILELAIEKLQDNAAHYQVDDSICGIVQSIDDYPICENRYDLILGISALEHMDSEESFAEKLEAIQEGVCKNGVACLIINSNVKETDKTTGKIKPVQFEVNLSTYALKQLLKATFADWEILKETVVHQSYDIPREWGTAQLDADVVTWVVRRK